MTTSSVANEKTFQISIYVGLREGYGDGVVHSIEEVYAILQKYCDEQSYCVTITSTTFVYKGGQEPGIIVGLINYPRSPILPTKMLIHARDIADLLVTEFKQYRCSIVCPNRTFLIENDDLKE